MKLIQVHGLQRSGTNYVRYMIEHHFKDVSVISVGKHEPNVSSYSVMGPEGLDGFTGYLVIVKDPYAWVASFSDWMWKRFKRYPEYEMAFKVILQAKHNKDLLRRWNVTHYAWRELLKTDTRAVLWRYERVLANPGACLDTLAGYFGLEWKDGAVIDPPKKHLRWLKDKQQGLPVEAMCRSKYGWMPEFSKRDYYLNREYMKYFEPWAIKEMSDRLDSDLVEWYGYRVQECYS